MASYSFRLFAQSIKGVGTQGLFWVYAHNTLNAVSAQSTRVSGNRTETAKARATDHTGDCSRWTLVCQVPVMQTNSLNS